MKNPFKSSILEIFFINIFLLYQSTFQNLKINWNGFFMVHSFSPHIWLNDNFFLYILVFHLSTNSKCWREKEKKKCDFLFRLTSHCDREGWYFYWNEGREKKDENTNQYVEIIIHWKKCGAIVLSLVLDWLSTSTIYSR